MASFYNSSLIAYNDASTPYNGVPTIYTYTSPGLTIILQPNYALEGLNFTYYYPGHIGLEFDPSASNTRQAFVRNPAYAGLTLRGHVHGTAVIRQFNPTVKDPIRTGGCPQCGTYVYNG